GAGTAVGACETIWVSFGVDFVGAHAASTPAPAATAAALMNLRLEIIYLPPLESALAVIIGPFGPGSGRLNRLANFGAARGEKLGWPESCKGKGARAR